MQITLYDFSISKVMAVCISTWDVRVFPTFKPLLKLTYPSRFANEIFYSVTKNANFMLLETARNIKWLLIRLENHFESN